MVVVLPDPIPTVRVAGTDDDDRAFTVSLADEGLDTQMLRFADEGRSA